MCIDFIWNICGENICASFCQLYIILCPQLLLEQEQKIMQVESESGSCSVVSNFLWPHGLYPIRLLCPWDSSGKNTGVDRQGIFSTQGLTWVSCIVGRFFTVWATREAQWDIFKNIQVNAKKTVFKLVEIWTKKELDSCCKNDIKIAYI